MGKAMEVSNICFNNDNSFFVYLINLHKGDVNSYVLMEDVIDKLHILDYEIKFCKQMKTGMKPIPRTYP